MPIISRQCQAFKPKYIALANEVYLRLPDDQPEINFHAVSCSVHHWVCVQNGVNRFPTFIAFKADSSEPIPLNQVTADSVAEAVGVRLNAPNVMENKIETDEEGGDAYRPVDILGASLDGLARTRETVYKDAVMSFTHALKTEIYPRREKGGQVGGPLDPVKREVFSDWIDLLYWTLPPTWILHTLINDIRNNIDSVMVSEESLLLMVEKHNDVVNGKHTTWSEQCSKGSDGVGYPCGLWSLLHIVSVGVMERHKAVLGARDQVSTKYVARTMRNYIDHFFGCEACRQYFVDMFDNCGFGHCRRFKQPDKLPHPESWGQFALWLWEVHNDINVKILEAASKREGADVSRHKLNLALWPPAEECPTCKDEKGKWSTDAVLQHLKKEYW